MSDMCELSNQTIHNWTKHAGSEKHKLFIMKGAYLFWIPFTDCKKLKLTWISVGWISLFEFFWGIPWWKGLYKISNYQQSIFQENNDELKNELKNDC